MRTPYVRHSKVYEPHRFKEKCYTMRIQYTMETLVEVYAINDLEAECLARNQFESEGIAYNVSDANKEYLGTEKVSVFEVKDIEEEANAKQVKA